MAGVRALFTSAFAVDVSLKRDMATIDVPGYPRSPSRAWWGMPLRTKVDVRAGIAIFFVAPSIRFWCLGRHLLSRIEIGDLKTACTVHHNGKSRSSGPVQRWSQWPVIKNDTVGVIAPLHDLFDSSKPLCQW
jgi:hypothetical protein